MSLRGTFNSPSVPNLSPAIVAAVRTVQAHLAELAKRLASQAELETADSDVEVAKSSGKSWDGQ